MGHRQQQSLASLLPPDQATLSSIHAIGEAGHLVSTSGAIERLMIKPIDCSELPVGEHRVYACLTHDHKPCGDPVEVLSVGQGQRPTLVPGFQVSRVVLEVGDDRFSHRDWIQVAEIHRTRSAGHIATSINERFHPPISSMAAYYLPNPILPFVEQVLAVVDNVADAPSTYLLRAELFVLRTLGTDSSPLTVFGQLQRCLHLLPTIPQLADHAAVKLAYHAYRHSTFCRILTELQDCLESHPPQLYPDVLTIDGERFHRLDGEFSENGDFWLWESGRDHFAANALALYLQRVDIRSIPNIRFSLRADDERSFGVARRAGEISASGSAIIFDRLGADSPNLYIGVDAVGLRQRLRMQLGEGHAIYYR